MMSTIVLLALLSLTAFATTQPLIILSNYSSELTLNSKTYSRNESSGVIYYYEEIEVRVNTTGNYTFKSSSSIRDTYSCLYQRFFYPFDPSLNIVTQDANVTEDGQFQLTAALRDDLTYILVFTTYHERDIGSFSIIASGPDNVFHPIEVLPTTTPSKLCDTFGFKESPMLYNSDTAPHSVISADFNKDGHSDLVVTNYGANTVSIFLGIGNGSFQSPSMNFSTSGNKPYSLVANDFNNDGNLDLAISNEETNTIAVLLGLGNGSFQLPAITFASGGSLPSSIIATDLNNDNQIDLVVTNTGSNIITIFFGIGNGNFQLPGEYYAAGSLPSSITNGDFNGDGEIDLAVVSRGSNKLLIFFGFGNGTFWSNFTSYTTESFPYVVRSADFNGDSKLDLAVGNFRSNSISIFLGTDSGAFVKTSPSTYATTGAGPIDITIQDLNGDAVVDLAVSNQIGNTITVYLGNGNGTFEEGKNYSSMGTKLQSIIAQDFDEDGIYDLAVANQNTNTLAILLTQCV